MSKFSTVCTQYTGLVHCWNGIYMGWISAVPALKHWRTESKTLLVMLTVRCLNHLFSLFVNLVCDCCARILDLQEVRQLVLYLYVCQRQQHFLVHQTAWLVPAQILALVMFLLLLWMKVIMFWFSVLFMFCSFCEHVCRYVSI